jgi:hypothetical protein
MKYDKADYRVMLLELICHSNADPSSGIPLADKHVQHLAATAEKFLQSKTDHLYIAIALPPLINRSRYHCAHINIREKRIIYHGMINTQFGYCTAIHRLHNYSKDTALKYAAENWACDLVDLTYEGSAEKSELWNEVRHNLEPRSFPCEWKAHDPTTISEVSEDERMVHRAIEKQIYKLHRSYTRSAISSCL